MFQRRATAGLVVVLLAASACSTDSDRRKDHGEQVVAGIRLSAAEVRYGQTPRRDPAVTLQPDVVLVEAGAEAVRSVTADGLSWTLDASARGVADLTPGRVMFLTARGVGRVLDIRRTGDDVVVTVGPVELTEIVRDGEFTGDRPVELSDALAYSSEGALWTDEAAVAAASAAPAAPGSGGPRRPGTTAIRPRWRVPAEPEPERVEMPKPTNQTKPVNTNGFSATPRCCASGVGADLTYDDGEIHFSAGVMLTMQRPSARFRLSISGGRISRAELQMHGGAGLSISLQAGSRVGTDRQLKRHFTIPVDFTVPVGLVLGIPFTLTASQEVKVSTAFSARDGNLTASGEYNIGGVLGFGYRDGSWGPHRIHGPHLKRSMLDSIRGVSVGANGVVLTYKTLFTLGVGALGFKAGLNVALTVSTGVARGSALAQFFPLAPGTRSIDCRGVSLTLDMTYSVGYTIPAPVAAVVNFFLRVFQAKPISRNGGIPQPPHRISLFDDNQYEPHGCQT